MLRLGLEHAKDRLRKAAHASSAKMSREASSAIDMEHKVRCEREVVHKIADAVLEMESVGYRVTIILVSGTVLYCTVL